jgi:hypothetical protein
MAEPLKRFFDAALIRSIGESLQRAYPALRTEMLVAECLDGFEALELVARGAHVAEVMRRHLPAEFTTAADVIVRSLGPELDGTESFGMAPFRYLPHVMFVGRYGLGDFEAAMRAQYELTKGRW